MCGWVGCFGKPAGARALEAASATIASRGPDDAGILLEDDGPLPFGLAHRRLSIQDPSPSGHQPMVDDGRGVAVAYNGEIYNAPELRNELVKAGHRFRSTSDTEVLLRGYLEWGDGVLQRIEGIFSFAITDRPQARVLLARDRLGVKPLYWATVDGAVVAGSAPRALIALEPGLARNIDRIAIAQFLTLLWIPHPRTPWTQIHKLPPGRSLVVERGQVRTIQYWRAPDPVEDELPPEELLDTIREAANRQLLSDVPVGILLSGGLDSTLLAHLVADKFGHDELLALTAGYDATAQRLEIAPDDTRYARQVTRSLDQVRLSEVEIAVDPGEAIDTLRRHFDDPVADPAAITLYELCRASSTKVLLSGVGGEELWAGYPRHLNLGRARAAARIPSGLRRLARAGSPLLFGGTPGPAYGGRRNLQKLARAVGDDEPPHYWRLMAQLTRNELRSLLPDAADDALGELDSMCTRLDDTTLADALAFDRAQFLPNLNLAYVDKASMATGIEIRVPLLDEAVTALTYRARPAAFVAGGSTKVPLRTAARGTVDQAIIDRPKSGFGGPARAWFRSGGDPPLADRIDNLARSGMVASRPARTLVHATATGRQDSSLAAWALVCLDAWRTEFA